MTRVEALSLAAQLGFELPKSKPADALLELCNAAGFKLGVCHEPADWLVWDENDRVLARVS